MFTGVSADSARWNFPSQEILCICGSLSPGLCAGSLCHLSWLNHLILPTIHEIWEQCLLSRYIYMHVCTHVCMHAARTCTHTHMHPHTHAPSCNTHLGMVKDHHTIIFYTHTARVGELLALGLSIPGQLWFIYSLWSGRQYSLPVHYTTLFVLPNGLLPQLASTTGSTILGSVGIFSFSLNMIGGLKSN